MKKIGKINGIEVYESKFMPKGHIMMTSFKDLPSLKKLIDLVNKHPSKFNEANITNK